MPKYRLNFLICTALLTACSDYELQSKLDGSGSDDTAESQGGGDSSNVCDPLYEPPQESVVLSQECEVMQSEGSFNPIIEWNWGSSFFCGPAAVAQTIDTNGSGAIDSEDTPIVFVYQGGQMSYGGGKVVALYGDNSGPVAWESALGYGQDGGFAIGDLDGDGWPEVVTADISSVCALDGRDGSEKWCAVGLAGTMDPYSYNYPSIADMNGDGVPEVTIGRTIIHGTTGVILGQGSYGFGAAPYEGTAVTGTYGALSVPIDLDGDGNMELVTGNAAYDIYGNAIWTNGGTDGIVAVADFDGDGKGEIIKTSGYYLYGMEHDGTPAWGPLDFSGYGVNLGPPAIDDLDGDGTPEFVMAAQNYLIAYEWGGSEMWRVAISDYSGAAGPVLFDFEMDGYPEVLYADEVSIRFFSGLDGTEKYSSTTHQSYTILETPIVADVDGDGQVEIAIGHCGDGWSNTYGAITVYGDADQTWPPGRKIWNQHAYYITNVDDLGGIPTGSSNNWELYNSFRSGDVGRPPSEYWDLRAEVLDVCEDECDQGIVYIGARVKNAGNIDAPADIPLSLRAGFGGPVISEAQTPGIIPAGTTGAAIVFEVNPSLLQGQVPVITADENSLGIGTVYECDENNNIDIWADPLCQ
jgi:hypothetical protein